jgi:hypothetical protein
VVLTDEGVHPAGTNVIVVTILQKQIGD